MDKNLEKLSAIAKGHEYEALKKLAGSNNVDHPFHYNRPDAMECIDEMILVFGPVVVMHFCLCNAWKYRYRAADKNGTEDISKSDWYLAKYKELKEKGVQSSISVCELNPVDNKHRCITIPAYERLQGKND